MYKWIESGLQEHVNELAGKPLNIKSPKQMQSFLYKDLRMAPVTKNSKDQKTKERKKGITADARALILCRRRYPQHSGVLNAILKLSEVRTRVSNTIETRCDTERDGSSRFRASFGMNPKTGRLSSSENPIGSGRNAQNFERSGGSGGVGSLDIYTQAVSTRRMLIPDNPQQQFFIEADLSQAEARVVAWLANETKLINIFLTGGDIHTINTCMIFKITPDKVTKEKRYLGKKTSHAANYGEGARMFCDSVLEETNGEIYLLESEGEIMLETYHSGYSKIRSNYHAWVNRQLKQTGMLWSPPPFCCRRIFHGRVSESSTLKEALAHIPQNVVGGICNEGVMHAGLGGIDLRLQAHDALVVQVALPAVDGGKSAFEAWKNIKKGMTIPIDFTSIKPDAYAEPLIIPVDFSVGRRYGEMVELKKIGEDEEMAEEFFRRDWGSWEGKRWE